MNKHKCALCKDEGYLMHDIDFTRLYKMTDVVVPCHRCATGEHRAAMARRSGLEQREQLYTLDDWRIPALEPELQVQRRRAKTAIQCAVQYRRGFYTFWGDFGAGKSLALHIAINELRKAGIAGCYEPMASILEHLRQAYEHRDGTGNYWQRLLSIPALAIDEVTRINGTEWAHERLFELIDVRYRKRRTHATLLATNDDPTQSLPPEHKSMGYLYSRTLAPRCGAVQVCVKGRW